MAKGFDLFGSAPVQDRIREAKRMRDGREAKRMREEYARATVGRGDPEGEALTGFAGRLCGKGLTLLAVFSAPLPGSARNRLWLVRWLQ